MSPSPIAGKGVRVSATTVVRTDAKSTAVLSAAALVHAHTGDRSAPARSVLEKVCAFTIVQSQCAATVAALPFVLTASFGLDAVRVEGMAYAFTVGALRTAPSALRGSAANRFRWSRLTAQSSQTPVKSVHAGDASVATVLGFPLPFALMGPVGTTVRVAAEKVFANTVGTEPNVSLARRSPRGTGVAFMDRSLLVAVSAVGRRCVPMAFRWNAVARAAGATFVHTTGTVTIAWIAFSAAFTGKCARYAQGAREPADFVTTDAADTTAHCVAAPGFASTVVSKAIAALVVVWAYALMDATHGGANSVTSFHSTCRCP